ncbi:MAG: hypothetical protein AB1847_15870 [bacterium]
MIELRNLDKVPPHIQSTVTWYSQDMIQIHQGNLKSITIYGSAAGEDYIPGRSNINLILVFDHIPFSVLKSSLKLIASGRKKRVLAPLFLTKEHILSSCDTFPIEYLDIKEKHVTLYGEDIFQKLRIEKSNLRLQCEQEIKGKLIRLRQAYLEMGLKKSQIECLLSDSLTALIPAFRSIIRLKNGLPPQSRDKVIQEIVADFQLQAEVFMKVLHIKEGKLGLDKPDLEKVMDDYLRNLDELAQKVDALPVLL